MTQTEVQKETIGTDDLHTNISLLGKTYDKLNYFKEIHCVHQINSANKVIQINPVIQLKTQIIN